MIWDRDNTTQLCDMWREGYSASQIGRKMGVTRNAAMSQVAKHQRLGVLSRRTEAINKPLRANPSGPPAPKPKPKAPKPVKQASRDLLLIDLPSASCHYPTTKDRPHRFCGHDSEAGLSWCPYHRSLVYNPSPPTKPKTKRWNY